MAISSSNKEVSVCVSVVCAPLVFKPNPIFNQSSCSYYIIVSWLGSCGTALCMLLARALILQPQAFTHTLYICIYI